MKIKIFDADANGLRAIAIIMVMGFHYGITPFTGGFVGVDVFFVISGYVITMAVLDKLQTGSFSVLDYFRSRFFRIFPALVVASVLTLAASSIILFPSDLEVAARHAWSSILFISNFQFWKDVGYFDTANEFKPYLHTWSLSVEWQFYMFWPIAVYILYRFRHIAPVLLCLAIVLGVIASVFMVQYKNFAFYMMPLRAWEFAIGALIAFVPLHSTIRQSFSAFCLLGGAGLILGAVLYTKETQFPGIAALLPCLSAFCLLFFNRRYLSSFLERQPLQYLGTISYSLYLYHWPVHVLYSQALFRELTYWDTAIIIVIAVCLAHLSFKFVEQPFRGSHFKLIPALGVLSGIAMICLCVSFYVIGVQGKILNYTAEQRQLMDFFQTERDAYIKAHYKFYPRSNEEKKWSASKHAHIPCSYDEYQPVASRKDEVVDCVVQNLLLGQQGSHKFIIIGDSNGNNTFSAFMAAYPDKSFAFMRRGGCAPTEVKNCFPELHDQLARVFSKVKVQGVILSSRFSYQEIDGIEQTVHFLREKNMPFMIIGSTPALRVALPKIMIKKDVRLGPEEFALKLNGTYFHDDIDDKDAYLQALSLKYGGVFWSKKAHLCPGDVCLLKASQRSPVYLDDQHLSIEGIKLLTGFFRESKDVMNFLN